jgi:hypothetical protein
MRVLIGAVRGTDVAISDLKPTCLTIRKTREVSHIRRRDKDLGFEFDQLLY